MKRLYLIRHAEAEFMGRGRGDHGRVLTDEGRTQAQHLGEMLADAGISVVLHSTADRATQTAEGLGLDVDLRPVEDLYNAGTRGILSALAGLDDSVEVAALVAHAPGVPSLVDELAGSDADPHAAASVLHHYPTATAAGIEFTGSWANPTDTRLFWAGRG
ncbi:MAG: histidine phosphatase family protein [Propionibacteriaceae bacterium]|nr:histidine phosphatase family protein [Propionibacteriaceae bacterium]